MVKNFREVLLTGIVNDLAKRVDASPRHIQKLIEGYAIPSKLLTKDICRVLQIDFSEADHARIQDLSNRDRFQTTH